MLSTPATSASLMKKSGRGKKLRGWALLVLGLLVITGIAKVLEAFALGILPEWAFTM